MTSRNQITISRNIFLFWSITALESYLDEVSKYEEKQPSLLFWAHLNLSKEKRACNIIRSQQGFEKANGEINRKQPSLGEIASHARRYCHFAL